MSTAPPEKRRVPRSKSVPKVPFAFSAAPPLESIKKVPMNKIVVGAAPSPNLLSAQSRIGSLANTKHRPGGGNVKIENRKLDWNTQAKTKAINEKYTPGGGDVKIENRKLDWNAESRIGSTKNLRHKAGGGNIQIHNE